MLNLLMLHEFIELMDEIRLGASSRVILFTTSDGVRLNGLLSSGSSKRTCILFIHGMGGSAFSHVALSLINYLPRSASVFSINTRGYGLTSGLARYRRGKRRSMLGGTNFERFEDSPLDIRAAIDVLSRLGYKRIILCGHSTGCQKAAYYQYKSHDRRVKGIVLVAPCDDYNLHLSALGRRYEKIAKECARMIRSGKGDNSAPYGNGFSAQRLDSVINPKRVESRLFNYDGKLSEFGRIKTPMLAIFGTREENAVKRPRVYLGILEKRTASKRFSSVLIEGANHSFYGAEKRLAKSIWGWMEKM